MKFCVFAVVVTVPASGDAVSQLSVLIEYTQQQFINDVALGWSASGPRTDHCHSCGTATLAPPSAGADATMIPGGGATITSSQ
jgi:hypothetical protein